jgi:hypothetical protein
MDSHLVQVESGIKESSGAGAIGVSPRARMSLSLGRFTAVFRAEVCPVEACAVGNINSNYRMCVFSLTVKLPYGYFNLGNFNLS